MDHLTGWLNFLKHFVKGPTMSVDKLLCYFGRHRWRRVDDMLGCFGMGLEWFECWECARCPATADQVRASPRTYQVHPDRSR